MTLRARLVQIKRVVADTPVSYGHTYATPRPTTLAVVPLGYADGIPRSASDIGPVQVHGNRHTVSGRVCMDQFVIDLGDDDAAIGDDVVIFGPGDLDAPTVLDWASAAHTIAYEILTRIGDRVERIYTGGPHAPM
ncbi:alanine racemase C-terminal domain-containing protein [Nocardia xishanensis]|uniref:Alanine racemase C-terminal domain-containing protein n=2 Tax=Nocardia xishanensis TaxID=238964 RepID=A0ABW7X7S4_9NOCA